MKDKTAIGFVSPAQRPGEPRDSASWPERRELVKSLGERLASEGPSEEILSSLLRLAEDPKWEVRKEVADLLLLLPERVFPEFVAVLAHDSNAFVRRAVARVGDRRRRGAQAAARKRRYLDQIERRYASIERRYGSAAAQEARRVAEQLHDAQLGAMVHDLQNIAAPLDAAVKALRGNFVAGDVDPQEAHQHLGRMARQTSALVQILGDMQVYVTPAFQPARPESLEDLAVQSHSTARAALEVGGRGLENVRVLFEIDESVSLVCNRDQLIRALANIIKNAYEAHSPAPCQFQSGEVRIVGRRVGADRAQFVVADNGMGIPPDELRALLQFKPGNKSNKATGTGFGLPIARRMVERHGGSLTIESKEGVGTEVTITIPAKRATGGDACTTR